MSVNLGFTSKLSLLLNFSNSNMRVTHG
jgi:hypothetical protein